ncbi:MAG TPA: DUF2914 domain-containing protein [Candidatus Polarisedimenticolia bacterium]|jgi:transcriptional regulator with XRE-family HTH domain
METFGQKVRQAVESQGLPLAEVAEATGLGIEHIQALERDDFSALPGNDTVEEGLRSLARLLDVDPDEVIADYNRERQRWLAAMPAEAEVEPSRTRSGRTGGIAILASAILALIVIAFLIWSRSSTAPESRPLALAQGKAPMKRAVEETRDLPGAPAGAVSPTDVNSRPPDSMKPGSVIEQPTDASELSIRQNGVGRGVVHHELVGGATQFEEGERVWFWNLIEGGAVGEAIDHVWLHEGKERLRVQLKLGGARWRTKSYKDLNPGSKGDWAVEARDEAGRVLARREFLCSPHR